ncbi:MAG: 30S ribosomal protein S6, partial [Proteobacteria bacterium]|nr:30S ribosomal protein S6 [Pseudomonadota bacterium]
RYQSMIKTSKGQIHRLEDWGRRQLAYPINKVRKAHYILMNVECNTSVIKELENAFRYNDAILRNLIIRRDRAITEPSSILKEQEYGSQHRAQRSADTAEFEIAEVAEKDGEFTAEEDR